MKYLTIILISILAFFILTNVVFAQDGSLPDTAVEGLDQLGVLLSSLAGLLAVAITDWIKKLKFLKPADREKVGGAVAVIIAVLSSSGIGALLAWLGPLALELDRSGIWTALVALLAVAISKGLFEIEGYRRALARYV